MNVANGGNEKRRLSAAKRALLEKRLRGDGVGTSQSSIPRQPPNSPLSLSLGQERLWYLAQLHPHSPAYHMCVAYDIRGSVDADKLERAFQVLVDRHQSLRTRIVASDGVPYAQLNDGQTLGWSAVDFSAVPAEERPRKLDAYSAEFSRLPFDLSTGPLLRGQLIVCGDDETRLLLAMHHIVADEWSLKVMWKEVAAIYSAPETGQQPPPLTLQYSDFAVWQRNRCDSDALEQQRAHWLERLDGAPRHLDLPTNRRRTGHSLLLGDVRSRDLPAALATELRRIAQQEKVSLFVLSLAAFAVLIQRYTRRDDFLIGTPVSNRGEVELESLVGFFVNTLPIRVTCEPAQTFLDLLQSVRETVATALENQEVPFEELVRRLSAPRGPSRHPLLQVMFVWQTEPDVIPLDADVTLRPNVVHSGGAKLDLTCFMQERNQNLSAMVEFDNQLFDSAMVDRMLGHWETLLSQIAARPETPVEELSLLSADETQLLIQQWNDTALALPDSKPVHEQICAAALRTGETPAVVWEGRAYSYQELVGRADSLAMHLVAKGVGPGQIVGLSAERSFEMVVGILGILRAGAAYLPLPPDYPDERIRFMVLDSGAKLVVATADSANAARFEPARLVRLDAGDLAQTDLPINQLDDTAYVIYTSGSTGQAKGVPISHRNLLNSTFARTDYYREPPQRFLLLSPYAFDSSVAGIFWTLCSGGTLVLPPEGLERDVQQLGVLISSTQVTHLLCLPSLYALLLEFAGQHLGSLRVAIVAGEPCPAELAERHHAVLQDTELHNEYGPTEATVWSTVYKLPPTTDGLHVPIGRPIANMQAFVLDERQKLCPIGVPGELCLSGAGVAGGYLERQELTAQRFVPHPFSAHTGDVIYRTGDLVRYLPDGNLLFLGRLDGQVKVRGHRIELGEIESVLQSHPEVADAAVIALSGTPPNSAATLEELADRLCAEGVAGARILEYVAGLSQQEAARALEEETR